MSFALSAGVSGLKVHQSMLDVAGNNLANVNTTAYKASNITFSELLSQTVKKASSPSGTLGGTNPQQMGSGVGISSVNRNMSQGNISATGQDLDCAIDGEGYFVLNDGTKNIYTRIGSFAVDSDNTLVDPSTGYKVQRIGTAGESEGFQVASDSSIHIPWDASLPANATSLITVNGNLRTSGPSTAETCQKITSDLAYTTASGVSVATTATLVTALDQFDAGVEATPYGAISITGLAADGATALAVGDYTVTDASTVQNVLDWISGKFANATAALNSDGKIVLTSDTTGYSQEMISGMAYTEKVPGTSTDTLTVPTYFDLTTIGGNDTKSFNITVYDSMGDSHVLTGNFVKTNTTNTWDLVIKSVTGESTKSWADYDVANALNRRISGIQFSSDGSYNGLADVSEQLTFGIKLTNNPTITQNVLLSLGTEGEFTGLTQFASEQSSASALSQDGYEAGSLASISIDNAGVVVGTFSNGVKKDVASLQMGVFQNPGGLEAVGNGYFLASSNSGDAVAGLAATGGAGTITGKSLEQSNVDVASEFVNMMQAQNGFQANARTIRIANDVLRELTNLIR
jgi:flagellar hook protein FlgE